MIPIVVVHGEADGLTRWLERKGCRVLFWTPVWERQLVDLYEAAQAKTMSRAHAMVEGERRQEARLPLLSSSSVFASAFLRLDISQMGFVDEFVLYTDADVVFLRDLTLVELQRPSVLACAPEDQFSVPFPCNSGVMTLNLPVLSITWPQAVDFMLRNHTERGIGWYRRGFVDQGVLNSIYEGQMQSLPAELNCRRRP